MISKICLYCGSTFKINPYREQTAKYCSDGCRILAQKGKHLSPKTEFKKGHTNSADIRRKIGTAISKRRAENDWVSYKPNLTPTPELSYLLGAIIGDGSICEVKGNYVTTLAATDREFVEKVASCIRKVVGRQDSYPIFQRETRRWNTLYRINAHSKELYKWLKEGWVSHKDVIEQYPNDFLRGFFDAEGGVRISGKHKEVACANTNRELMIYIQTLLEKLGISSKFYIESREINKDCYRLKIRTYNAIWEFAKNVSFSIVRKKEKLLKIIQNFENKKEEKEKLKQLLYEKYWGEKKSIYQMAKELGINDDTIRMRMIALGIPRRTRSEALHLRRISYVV
jgi:hypothetical protein